MNYMFGDRLTWQEYLSKLINGGATAPYYYVPLLIQLFILSPLIVEAVKRNWKATLIISFSLQVPVLVANYLALFRSSDLVPAWFNTLFLDWRVPAYLMWFTLGACIAWKVTAFKQLIIQHKNKLLVLWLFTFIVSIIEWEILRNLTQREWIHIQVTASYRLFALVFIPLLLSINLKNTWFTSKLTDISSRSYGIYLVHAPVMILTAKITYHVAPFLLQYTLLFQILLVAVSLGIPYLAMVTLERTPFRGLYSYIFG